MCHFASLVALLLAVTAPRLVIERDVLRSVDALDTFFEDTTSRRQSCQIRGVLQRKWFVKPQWELIVKESSGQRAAFVTNVDWPVAAGDEVVLDGYATLYPNLEAYLTATNVTVVGHGTVDPALELRLRDLDEHTHDLCEVITGGTVVDVCDDEIDHNYGILRLRDDDQLLSVHFKREDFSSSLAPQSAVEAQIRVRGIFRRTISGERKFYGPFLHLIDPDGLSFVTQPPSDPYAAPHLNDTLYLSPRDILRLGRRTVTGRVLACWNGDTLLLRSDKGLPVNVELREDVSEPPPLGARVTAVGYPDTDRFHLILTRAICRIEQQPTSTVEEKSEPLDANSIVKRSRGREFVNPYYHGKLVTLYGTVRSIPGSSSPSHHAYVESKDFNIPVNLSAAQDAFKDVEIGTRVSVTGRCILQTENWRTFNAYPKAKGFMLVVRSAQDVSVLERPPWWTPRRLMMVIGLMFAALVGLYVRSRLQRHISRLKFAERTALAVELHDSLSQALGGLACQIAATDDALDGGVAPAKGKLKTAVQMLDSCRTELRNCLFDLRSDTLGEKNLAQAVRRTLEPFEGCVLIAIRFNVRRDLMDDATAHAILAIVRELTANAVRHGNAGSIRVAGVVDKATLLFSVTDDGCGFDPERCSGIADGHFGLNGIRDRIRRLNGSVEIRSVIGKGTKVIVKIPLKAK